MLGFEAPEITRLVAMTNLNYALRECLLYIAIHPEVIAMHEYLTHLYDRRAALEGDEPLWDQEFVVIPRTVAPCSACALLVGEYAVYGTRHVLRDGSVGEVECPASLP